MSIIDDSTDQNVGLSSAGRRVRRGNADDRSRFRTAAIEAALGLYRSGGLEAVTMRAVAAAVGTSAMALYRYFAGKAELLQALWDDVLDELAATVEAEAGTATDAADRQQRSVEAFLAYFEQRPEHFRLLYLSEQTVSDGHDPALTRSPAYRYIFEQGDAELAAFADQLGLATTPAQRRLALELRLALSVGFLHARLVNRRLPWQDLDQLREQAVAAILLGIERCLRTARPVA